jgi:hypothetical protein
MSAQLPPTGEVAGVESEAAKPAARGGSEAESVVTGKPFTGSTSSGAAGRRLGEEGSNCSELSALVSPPLLSVFATSENTASPGEVPVAIFGVMCEGLVERGATFALDVPISNAISIVRINPILIARRMERTLISGGALVVSFIFSPLKEA